MAIVSDYILDHPVAEIVRQYLVNQGEVDLPNTGGSWPCLLNYLIDEIPLNDVLVIYDENPALDGYAQRTGEFLCHYPITILLRNSDYELGYLKMFDIMVLLSSVVREVVTINTTASYLIQSASNQSGVVSTGLEDGTKRRRLFEMNLLVSVTKY